MIAPVVVNNFPFTESPVATLMAPAHTRLPLNREFTPQVAALFFTTQNTFLDCVPFISFTLDKAAAVKAYVEAAKVGIHLGFGINAGHDLNTENLRYFAQQVEGLLEVSIGHALISEALYLGLENTIQRYIYQLR